MKKTEMLLPRPTLKRLMSSGFTAKIRQEEYFVDDLLMEIEEKTAVFLMKAVIAEIVANNIIKRRMAPKVIRR